LRVGSRLTPDRHVALLLRNQAGGKLLSVARIFVVEELPFGWSDIPAGLVDRRKAFDWPRAGNMVVFSLARGSCKLPIFFLITHIRFGDELA
jgi:hypothetical protein